MAELSPAAQAVLDAANSRNSYGPDDCLNESRWIAAAALRAAADQVVPLTEKPNDEFCCPPVSSMLWKQKMEIRADLFALADELDPPSS